MYKYIVTRFINWLLNNQFKINIFFIKSILITTSIISYPIDLSFNIFSKLIDKKILYTLNNYLYIFSSIISLLVKDFYETSISICDKNYFNTVTLYLDTNDKLDKNIIKMLSKTHYKKVVIEYNQVNTITYLKNINKFFYTFPYVTLNFNNSIDEIPDNITHVQIKGIFNQPIYKLSSSLVYLELGYKFNNIIKEYPRTLKYLIFGDCFNQELGNLPENLIYLQLGRNFNKSLDNLPSSIKYLYLLDSKFNNSVDNIPNKIKELVLTGNFNKSIDNLPTSLQSLLLGNKFNQPIDNLPRNLLCLRIENSIDGPVRNLPFGLKYLIFKGHVKNNNILLPKYLESFSYCFDNKDIGFFDINELPETLTNLTLLGFMDKEIKILPKNLKLLALNNDYKYKNNIKDIASKNIITYYTYSFYGDWNKILTYHPEFFQYFHINNTI